MRHEDSQSSLRSHALLPEDNQDPRPGQGGDTGLTQLLLTRGDGYKIILNMSPLSLLHVRHN